MNRKIIVACLAVLVASPLPALAGFYGGGSLGAGWYGSDVDIDGAVESFSESATAWKIYGGLASEAFMCVEGGYRNLGSTSTTLGDQNVSFGTSGWDLEMLARIKLGPLFVFGKVGGIAYKTETSAGIEEKKKTGLLAGLGAWYSMGELGIRLEWEYLDVEVPDNVSMGTLGLTYEF